MEPETNLTIESKNLFSLLPFVYRNLQSFKQEFSVLSLVLVWMSGLELAHIKTFVEILTIASWK